MGTSVTNGTATAVMVRTGSDTQYGEIVRNITRRETGDRVRKGVRRFGVLMMQVSFVLVVFVFFVNALFKQTSLDPCLFAVALTVGLTPGCCP